MEATSLDRIDRRQHPAGLRQFLHHPVPGTLQFSGGAIEYERRSYTGALTYSHDNGGVVRLNDSDMEFFGPPSASIDESWKYLLHGM
jgi:hypothetical protein